MRRCHPPIPIASLFPMAQISQIIKQGQVAVIPTDTIYGIVASALNKQAVEEVYRLRKRNPEKPCIILASSLEDIENFGITLDQNTKNYLNQLWPNPVSVILSCPNPKFEYLHRGTNTLAFRIPKSNSLLGLLKQTGPIIAPSANFEGMKPATTIEEAKSYFKDEVPFYEDQGELNSEPSTLIQIQDNQVTVLRQGVYQL